MLPPHLNRLPLTRAELETPSPVPPDARARLTTARAPQAAYAGLLLRLGYWEESHNAASEIDTVEGSYWHAILHRMEPDFGNAGYWFRRVGEHPIFPSLYKAARDVLEGQAGSGWRLPSRWDPFEFLRRTEQALKGRDEEGKRALQEIAHQEWELLFAWCSTEDAKS